MSYSNGRNFVVIFVGPTTISSLVQMVVVRIIAVLAVDGSKITVAAINIKYSSGSNINKLSIMVIIV